MDVIVNLGIFISKGVTRNRLISVQEYVILKTQRTAGHWTERSIKNRYYANQCGYLWDSNWMNFVFPVHPTTHPSGMMRWWVLLVRSGQLLVARLWLYTEYRYLPNWYIRYTYLPTVLFFKKRRCRYRSMARHFGTSIGLRDRVNHAPMASKLTRHTPRSNWKLPSHWSSQTGEVSESNTWTTSTGRRESTRR